MNEKETREQAERVWEDQTLALCGPIETARSRGIAVIAAALAEKDREIERQRRRRKRIIHEARILAFSENYWVNVAGGLLPRARKAEADRDRWKAQVEELRNICVAVWDAWKNTDNATDPDAEGYAILQRVKAAALEDER